MTLLLPRWTVAPRCPRTRRTETRGCRTTYGRRRSPRAPAARCAHAASARARTARVSRGSMTPSSQRRAVAYHGRPWSLVLLLELRADLGLADLGHHGRGLLAAHDGDPRVGPHEQEARRVGAAAHPVVAGAERAADDHGDLGHARGRDGGDELRPVLGDAARLVVLAHHEPGDVLEEQQRDAAAVAQLDEVRGLQRGLAEQDAVVGDDPDRVAVEVRERGDDRRAVELLELLEIAAVDDAAQEVAGVVGRARVDGDEVEQLVGAAEARRARRGADPRRRARPAGASRRCSGRSPRHGHRLAPGGRRRRRCARARRRRPAPRR